MLATEQGVSGGLGYGYIRSEEGHTKPKTGAISGSTNWASVQQKNFEKKKKNEVSPQGPQQDPL